MTKQEAKDLFRDYKSDFIIEKLYQYFTESFTDRISCENCQQWDSLSEICKQNGCEDYTDWVLWNPKNESDKH